MNFGILLEYQTAKINVSGDLLEDTNITTQGIAVGVLAEYKIAKSLYFGIQPKIALGELTMDQVVASLETYEEGLIEIQLPIYLQYVLNLGKINPNIMAGYSFNINVTEQNEGLLIADQNNHSLFAQVGADFKAKHFTVSPYVGYENGISNVTDFYNSNDELLNSRKMGIQLGVKFKGSVL